MKPNKIDNLASWMYEKVFKDKCKMFTLYSTHDHIITGYYTSDGELLVFTDVFDELVDYWHEVDTEESSLYKFLGMSREQYRRYVEGDCYEA